MKPAWTLRPQRRATGSGERFREAFRVSWQKNWDTEPGSAGADDSARRNKKELPYGSSYDFQKIMLSQLCWISDKKYIHTEFSEYRLLCISLSWCWISTFCLIFYENGSHYIQNVRLFRKHCILPSFRTSFATKCALKILLTAEFPHALITETF